MAATIGVETETQAAIHNRANAAAKASTRFRDNGARAGILGWSQMC